MYRGTLTREELPVFHAGLRGSHQMRMTITLTDLDGRVRGSLTTRVTAGQIEVDRHHFGESNGPTRRATLTFLDPDNALGIDSSDPDAGALYYDRRISIVYGVNIPGLGWVDIPVFCGVPWRLQRTGDEVNVDADDLSVLGGGAAWRPKRLPKGMRKVDAIRELLSTRVGYSEFRLPERKTRLSHPVSLDRHQHPWQVARHIASSMDLELYVDGAGAVTARRLPEKPIWTFNAGEDGEIVDDLALSTDRDGFANVVTVIGRKIHGSKKRVQYPAVAPRHDPNSPWNLKVNGVPNFVEYTIQNDHFRTVAECKRKADRLLADKLRKRSEATCSILPWPHMEEGDKARFVTLGGDPTVDRIDSFVLPLSASGGPMTLNWRGSAMKTKRRIRVA